MKNHKAYWIALSLMLSAGFVLGGCAPTQETPAEPTPAETNQPEPEATVIITEEQGEETAASTAGTEPASTTTPTQPAADFEPVIQLQQVAQGLTAPVDLDSPDDGTGRLFITDQVGLIYVIDSEGNQLETPFLDLRSRMVDLNPNYDERGLLGLAFHPAYAENGRFFVYYSAPRRPEAPSGYNHTSLVSEFSVSVEDPNIADPDSERVILPVDQPQGNHNAGAIAFSPADGFLYIPLGDGGSGSDRGPGHAEDWYAVNAGGNGQDVEENPLGSILRIDVNSGDPYAVPTDNPAISENYPETWAYGFRNPYRMAFDPGGDHELFLGDVGQELWEEVSIVEAGGNYGWNVKEGTHCFSTSNPGDPDAITDCPTTDPSGNRLIDPIIEFRNTKHPEGGLSVSIIGGVVYRGASLPTWDGRYVFGQWSTTAGSPQGGLYVAERADEGLWDFQEIEIQNRQGGGLHAYLLALGNDQDGEVYVLTSQSIGPRGNTGSVYRIIPPETTHGN